MNIAKILLPIPFDKDFDYKIPDGMEIDIGDFVLVPFGNKEIKAIVVRFSDNSKYEENNKIKYIIRKINIGGVSTSLIEFINFVSQYNLAKKGNIIKMVMPIMDAVEEIVPETYYKLSDDFLDIIKNNKYKISEKRQNIIDCLSKHNSLNKDELVASSNSDWQIIKDMIGKNIITSFHSYKKTDDNQILSIRKTILSDEQQKASESLWQKIEANKFAVTLIDGVTGSGKTEVYFDVIEKILKQQQGQVLILLPEIILTSQLISRFKQKFNFDPIEWHSAISDKKKIENWQKIITGEAKIVIGARSSLFLPFKNLKLIIIDEEHDSSLKQEEQTVYHARDMAVMRAKYENINIILASATPSLETIINCQNNKYEKIILSSRYNDADMPNIDIINLSENKLERNKWISYPLREEIANNLQRQKQVMLFLNKRGYCPVVICKSCGYKFSCPNCTSSLVLHNQNKKLECRYCGYFIKYNEKDSACKKCNNNELHLCGPGVERIEEEVKDIFPQARIMVLTSDNLDSKKKIDLAINQIMDNQVDIIIGTQMVAKGHHFPNLSLVGVVDTDIGLDQTNLRASEKLYQMLYQIAGRAGREKGNIGKVLIQSHYPNNIILQSLKNYDREKFIKYEMEMRKMANMPPFSNLAAIIVTSSNSEKALLTAKGIAKIFPVSNDISLFGPAPAPLNYLKRKYRYRLLIKTNKNINIQNLITSTMDKITVPSNISIKIDINPYNFT